MSADGMLGYNIWRPLYVHFRYESFDIFSQRLKPTTDEHILNHKSILLFANFEYKYQYNNLNMKQALVANYILGDFDFPFSCTGDHKDVWLAWLKRRQSITKVFSDDLKLLSKQAILDDPYQSQLFKLAISGQVCPETVVILDYHLQFLENWRLKLENTLHYEPIRIWTKYKKFVLFDEVKIKHAIQEWVAERNA